MRPITRRERRAERLRRYAAASEVRLTERLDCTVSGESGARRGTAHEAPLPGWLRHLDYKTSGETGAMRGAHQGGQMAPRQAATGARGRTEHRGPSPGPRGTGGGSAAAGDRPGAM
jgi:hypothetical protein